MANEWEGTSLLREVKIEPPSPTWSPGPTMWDDVEIGEFTPEDWTLDYLDEFHRLTVECGEGRKSQVHSEWKWSPIRVKMETGPGHEKASIPESSKAAEARGPVAHTGNKGFPRKKHNARPTWRRRVGARRSEVRAEPSSPKAEPIGDGGEAVGGNYWRVVYGSRRPTKPVFCRLCGVNLHC